MYEISLVGQDELIHIDFIKAMHVAMIPKSILESSVSCVWRMPFGTFTSSSEANSKLFVFFCLIKSNRFIYVEITMFQIVLKFGIRFFSEQLLLFKGYLRVPFIYNTYIERNKFFVQIILHSFFESSSSKSTVFIRRQCAYGNQSSHGSSFYTAMRLVG